MVVNNAVGRVDHLGLQMRNMEFNDDNLWTKIFEEPDDPVKPHCFNEGYMRHCTQSCILALYIGNEAITQWIAQGSGNDRPGNPERDEGDVAANQTGIDISKRLSPEQSCKDRCREKFMEKLENECCKYPGMRDLLKEDEKCTICHYRQRVARNIINRRKFENGEKPGNKESTVLHDLGLESK
jgi:hypothetical protein